MAKKRIKISAEKLQNSAEKIQNNTEKIQKITNRIDWILSKRVCDVITIGVANFFSVSGQNPGYRSKPNLTAKTQFCGRSPLLKRGWIF